VTHPVSPSAIHPSLLRIEGRRASDFKAENNIGRIEINLIAESETFSE